MLSCLSSPWDGPEIALSAISEELITLAHCVYAVVLVNVKLNSIGVAQTLETEYRENLQQFTDRQGSLEISCLIATWRPFM